LTDGSVFDSSYDRGQPISFQVTGVIKGWTEALLLMQVGAKWELTIPSKLGYGARGSGARIPPNSTLLFEIELLEIE
jgi:FKBP-type peptidyl-prolyl cis-trans isomerase FklB